MTELITELPNHIKKKQRSEMNMKADYKNWMPKGMVLGTAAGAGIALILYILFGLAPVLPAGALKAVLGIVFLILTILLVLVTIWMYLMYRAFSYNGKRQMSKQIIEGTAAYVNIPDDGKGLDVELRESSLYGEGRIPCAVAVIKKGGMSL